MWIRYFYPFLLHQKILRNSKIHSTMIKKVSCTEVWRCRHNYRYLDLVKNYLSFLRYIEHKMSLGTLFCLFFSLHLHIMPILIRLRGNNWYSRVPRMVLILLSENISKGKRKCREIDVCYSKDLKVHKRENFFGSDFEFFTIL